nr:unnamed protein product [Naegleria fowleri]
MSCSQARPSSSRGIQLLSNPKYEVFPVLMQILSHLEPVANYALFGSNKRRRSDASSLKQQEEVVDTTIHTRSPFFQAFDQLLEYIWKSHDDPQDPSEQQLMERFVQTLKEACDSLTDNPDIMELYTLIVSLLMFGHHELENEFCGEITTTLGVCPVCTFSKHPCVEKVPKLQASTQLWKNFETTGIMDFVVTESIDEYSCQVCSTVYNVLKSDFVSKPPEILVLQLDRFNFNFETFTVQKSHTLFPLNVKAPLSLRYYGQQGALIQQYGLVAIANHEGQGVNGVYSCCFWNTASHKWYTCHGNQLPIPFTQNLEYLISPANYLLFFTKKQAQEKTSFLRQFGNTDISFTFSE